MLSVLYSEYKLWGCPNCGCDSVISSGVSGGGLTSGTCRHCKLKFDEDTLIKEINNENNLVWLCPNHHIMLEKGLISLE